MSELANGGSGGGDSGEPTATTARAIEVGELGPCGRTGGVAVAPAGALLNALRNVKVQVNVRLGAAEVTVGELLESKAQQVVVLDRHVAEPVEVTIEGHVVARGVLVAVEDRFGIRLTEVPSPLELPPGAVGDR